MSTRLMLGLLIWLASSGAEGQDRPDFSGRWVLESPALSDSVARELSVEFLPEQGPAGTIVIERRFGNDVQTSRYQIGIVGGIVTGRSSSQGRQFSTYHSTHWDDARLMFERESCSATDESKSCQKHEEAWALDAENHLTIVITDRSSGREPATIVRVYKRP